MSVVMPKQASDPSKPPRRGNEPWKDILLGIGSLVLAGLLFLWLGSMRRVSVRLGFAAVVFAIAGPVLIIRGLVNAVRDRTSEGQPK
jgi:hypothetical protein